MNEDNITIVFQGFLNLTNLEKLKLTEKINEYLDTLNREPLRAAAEAEFKKLNVGENDKKCVCCQR
ncbi:MAG TPA: hypothetical protein PKY59_06975 [Pyrinomonadaceae bacterium]|nr:hypothetical protein [Pyrinomonadaceae bacterium]